MSAFDFIDDDFFDGGRVARVHHEIRLLLATTLVLDEPVKDVGDALVLFVLEEWVVLEVNSEPAFDFIETEREKLIGTVLEFLKKEAVKN